MDITGTEKRARISTSATRLSTANVTRQRIAPTQKALTRVPAKKATSAMVGETAPTSMNA